MPGYWHNIIYTVTFDKTADLSATKSIFNYCWVWLLVCTTCNYFTPHRVCIQAGAAWKLDRYFTQDWEFKCDVSFGCHNSLCNSPTHCHRWIWVIASRKIEKREMTIFKIMLRKLLKTDDVKSSINDMLKETEWKDFLYGIHYMNKCDARYCYTYCTVYK